MTTFSRRPTPHSATYPTSVTVARVLSTAILQERSNGHTWRSIGQMMTLSRLEAMRLAHDLESVVDEIKTTNAAA